MFVKGVLCCLIISSALLRSSRCSAIPRAVMILSRHGDRSPVAGYPNDPYRDFQWPGGYGALSPKGIQQSCKSGEVKSFRYSALIRKHKIYVKSSAAQRCILSAESFLNGFLPVALRKHIGIEVTPPHQDEIFMLPGKPCPKYANTLAAALLLNQTEVSAILRGNEHLLNYIGHHSGLNITTLIEILNIYDTLAVQNRIGFETPAWARSIKDTYMQPLLHFAFRQMTLSQLMQVKSGYFLNEIVQRFDRCILHAKDDVLIFTAHDINISALMALLGVYNQTIVIPEFASSFVMELHKHRALNHDYEIRFLYFKDDKDQQPTKLRMPNCPSPCPFKLFKTVVAPKLISDYDSICN